MLGRGLKLSNVKVFFDGGCPLCIKEINHYQSVQNKYKIQNLYWQDISTGELDDLTKHKVTYEDAMTEMHVIEYKEESNHVYKGVESFLKVWERLPYYRMLAILTKSVPGVKPITSWMYRKWVLYRLRTDPRLQFCTAERCKPKM
ncbi:hypothetical protein AKO1_006073 [Acrasis kona]|uniref:DUF393 domain-containing protein n=1 Tax=Acrasis kona TaxID=1008807 RepID=A0AAW2YKK3_9EUKA